MPESTDAPRSYTWRKVWEDPDSGEIEFEVHHHIGEPAREQVDTVLYEEGDLWAPDEWSQTAGDELAYFASIMRDMLAHLPQYSTVWDGRLFGLPER